MKMLEANKLYKVTKRIKIHTKPLVLVDVVQTGRYVKQTEKSLIFTGFLVKKACVVSVEEVTDDG